MRHHRAQRTLGRVKRTRTALLRSLARSLILRGGITTTVAKAKELRPFVEELVTASKTDTLASRRKIRARLGNSGEASQKLYAEYAPRFKSRAGGYTRIIKLGITGKRVADMARIEFV